MMSLSWILGATSSSTTLGQLRRRRRVFPTSTFKALARALAAPRIQILTSPDLRLAGVRRSTPEAFAQVIRTPEFTAVDLSMMALGTTTVINRRCFFTVMVALIDAPRYRLGCAAIGGVFLAVGVLQLFLGAEATWGVPGIVVGAIVVLWAFLHKTRGLPVSEDFGRSFSERCWDGLHDECAGISRLGQRCSCRCHAPSTMPPERQSE